MHGETIRADAALLAAVQAGDAATLHTAAGAEISWAALHLLAQHGFRWKPEYPDDAARGPVGHRLHVDLMIEHAARPGIALGTTPARFLARALDVDVASSLASPSGVGSSTPKLTAGTRSSDTFRPWCSRGRR